MPTVVRLGNVKLVVYASDHNPPHVHILSAEHAAVMSMSNLEITAGFVPRHVYQLARDWAEAHRDELHEAWRQLNG